MTAALTWSGVSVSFGDRTILRDINLSVSRGQTLALVGESGSGKTMCCMAALGMLPKGGKVTSGTIAGPDGHWVDAEGGRTVPIPRGRRVTMVFQEPMTSLDPTMRCGQQIAEVILRHGTLTADSARMRVMSLFEEVQLPDPERAWSA